MRFAIVALSFLIISHASAQQTYTVQNWPADLDKVPCDAWKKNPDGSIGQTGTIIAGGTKMTGNSFKGGAEAGMIEKKCPAVLK